MRHDRLQMRLENDEPKCANCDKWDQDKSVASVGACRLALSSASSQALADPLRCAIALAGALRTDLSLCSKWELRE